MLPTLCSIVANKMSEGRIIGARQLGLTSRLGFNKPSPHSPHHVQKLFNGVEFGGGNNLPQ
jgi:hypothetical protein